MSKGLKNEGAVDRTHNRLKTASFHLLCKEFASALYIYLIEIAIISIIVSYKRKLLFYYYL